ncbi:MAG: ABC transporter substrate-binding protein [Ignavibacteria bacterium]|jgi:microcin C transport system substrate-binding protein
MGYKKGKKFPDFLKIINILLFIFSALFCNACSKKDSIDLRLNTSPISIKKYNESNEKVSNVPAELGGDGFDGKDWETNNINDSIKSEKTFKGGKITILSEEPPVTLRPYGKNSNTVFNEKCIRLMYESLLQIDQLTGKYLPSLATHWKISNDKKTFKFRINPKARWADGKTITSEDIIATWKLITDEGLLDPYLNQLFKTFEEPTAESEYIISFKSKVEGWRQFLLISTGFIVLPAHYIKGISGKDYLEKYQMTPIPGSGPYVMLEKDIDIGQSISVRRRSDYWGENEIINQNKNNFDVINFVFSAGELVDYERFLKGEIDVLNVNKISTWFRKFDIPEVKRGFILKRRIFNESPKSVYGLCINTKKEPLNDIRVRKALYYALNRKKIVGSLYFNEYELMNSFFAGTVYANPENPITGFNLDSATMLLDKSGWKEKNSGGYLVKNGKIFEIELPFRKGMDRFLTIYQEDLRKIGIKLVLKEIDFGASVKLFEDKNFNLLPVSIFLPNIPNPEHILESGFGDTDNMSETEDKRVSVLIEKYNLENNPNIRIELIKQIDKLLIESTGYILFWYSPSFHIAFHNYFKYPEYIFDREGGVESILDWWSYDKEKIEKYYEATKNEKIYLDTGKCDSKYWIDRK